VPTGRQHRIRSAPPAQELQIDVGQRQPDADDQLTRTVMRTGHAQIGSTHSKGSIVTDDPTRGRNDKEDHRHNMHVRASLGPPAGSALP
jgi:hypothetical protein